MARRNCLSRVIAGRFWILNLRRRSMSIILKPLAAAAVCVLVLTSPGQADEKKIPLDQVPKAVMKTVKVKFAGAELKGAEIEKEDGKTIYEIALKHEGNNYEVELTPDGKIIGYDKVISAKDVP